MKFSEKIEHGTSTEPLNFVSDPWPWRRFALSDCTLRAKICTLQVLVYLFFFIFKYFLYIVRYHFNFTHIFL